MFLNHWKVLYNQEKTSASGVQEAADSSVLVFFLNHKRIIHIYFKYKFFFWRTYFFEGEKIKNMEWQ